MDGSRCRSLQPVVTPYAVASPAASRAETCLSGLGTSEEQARVKRGGGAWPASPEPVLAETAPLPKTVRVMGASLWPQLPLGPPFA